MTLVSANGFVSLAVDNLNNKLLSQHFFDNLFLIIGKRQKGINNN